MGATISYILVDPDTEEKILVVRHIDTGLCLVERLNRPGLVHINEQYEKARKRLLELIKGMDERQR